MAFKGGTKSLPRFQRCPIVATGRLRKHLRKIPFHTTVLNWKLSGSGDPEAVYQELVHRLSDLMETLRGEEDE